MYIVQVRSLYKCKSMTEVKSIWTSKREKYLWLCVVIVIFAILSILFMGQPLVRQLRSQDVQAVFFLIGLLLVALAIILHGIRAKPGKLELSVIIGVAAVYIMFIFRLGAPERSHLIEYSVLAILIHKALLERSKYRTLTLKPGLLAFILAFSFGVLDESIQYFIPTRVFDVEDIIFNGSAVSMALIASLILQFVKNRFRIKTDN